MRFCDESRSILSECFFCSSSSSPLSLLLSCCILIYFALKYRQPHRIASSWVESSRVGSFIYFRFDGIFNSTSNKPNGSTRTSKHITFDSKPKPKFIHSQSVYLLWVNRERVKEKKRIIRCRFALCLNIVWISKTIAIGNTAFFPWTMSLEF